MLAYLPRLIGGEPEQLMAKYIIEDGTYFNAILGDGKGADAGSEWGHYFGSSVDIVEWESVVDQSTLRSNLSSAGWLNKKVDRIINYGTWLTGSKHDSKWICEKLYVCWRWYVDDTSTYSIYSRTYGSKRIQR